MQYIGDQGLLNRIEKIVKENKHHALMLCGPKGIGKSLAAKQVIANALQRESSNEIYNLKWISPEDNKSGKIAIEQIREINDFLNQTSLDGKYKFVVIDAADDLNVNAANSLLKPLEEPSTNSIFVLINHKPSAVLPTIKSRCVQLKFKPPTTGQLKEIIRLKHKIEEQELEDYIKIANDNIGIALNLIENEMLNFYRFLLKQFTAQNFQYVKFKDHIDTRDFGNIWQLYFHLLKRFLYILLNKFALLATDEKLLKQELPNVDVAEVAKLIDELNNIEYKITTLYLNKKDCFQILCLKTHKLCRKIFI